MKKRHESVLVMGSSPELLRDNLNREMNSLERYGWVIERIDQHFDYKVPLGEDPRSVYLIIAYHEMEDTDEI